MIEFVIFDIDGVITNGTIIVDSDGKEQKQINLKDIDAIFELKKRGFKIGAITGEDSEIVKYFQYRFPWDVFYSGNKSKRKTLELLCEEKGLEAFQICYIGDGKYDIDALEYAGLGVCPSDAIEKAKIAADVVLQQAGGQGCIWELVSFLEKYNDSNDSQNYVYQRLVEHMLIFKSMASDIKLKSEIIRVGDHLINIFQQNGSLFICGNGGSAADAQHIEAEFVSRFYKERPGLNAEALSVNTSCITAIGNDYCFEDIFVRQLQAKAKQGDMILGITTSGNSKNVVEAMRYGKKNGLTTVILTGEQAKLEWENNSDYTINIPSSITPRIQEAHIFCGHVLAEYVEHKMFN